MNPNSESSSPTTSSIPQSEGTSPAAAEKTQSDGRRRTLNEIKRREICALVAGGCVLRDAARYVGCSVRTIRREAQRNPFFDDQLRRSETYAQLSPLRAMQHAVSTHWRAAAWFLERAYPERFARPDAGAFGARQARRLLDEVLHIFSCEVPDPFHYERIEKRVRATFEYHVRSACDRRRNAGSLRKAMSFFDEKDGLDNPLASLGFATPDLNSLFRKMPGTPARPSEPDQERAAETDSLREKAKDFAEIIRNLMDNLESKSAQAAAQESPTATEPHSPTCDHERTPNGQ